MTNYRLGYETYKKACEKYDLEPVNFRYFIINLSQQQLGAFNDHVKMKRGQYEISI